MSLNNHRDAKRVVKAAQKIMSQDARLQLVAMLILQYFLKDSEMAGQLVTGAEEINIRLDNGITVQMDVKIEGIE